MPFQAILSTLLESHAPHVHAAIFCDDQGERVDSCATGALSDFEVALLGAAYAPLIPWLPNDGFLRVAYAAQALWLAKVDNGYYLLVVCALARDGRVRRDLPRVVAALNAHM